MKQLFFKIGCEENKNKMEVTFRALLELGNFVAPGWYRISLFIREK